MFMIIKNYISFHDCLYTIKTDWFTRFKTWSFFIVQYFSSIMC